MSTLAARRPSAPLFAALLLLGGLCAGTARAYDGDPAASGVAPFDLGGGLSDSARAVVVQADGKVVLVGTVNTGANAWEIAVARFLPGGGLDPTFGVGGKAANPWAFAANTWGTAAVALPDGRLLVAGSYDNGGGNLDFLVGRLLVNGQPDPTFLGSGGQVGYRTIPFDSGADWTDEANAMVLDDLGRIVIVGTADLGVAPNRDFAVARLTPDGQMDTTLTGDGRTTIGIDFSEPNIDLGRAVAIDHRAGGGIVVAGSTWNSGSSGWSYDIAVARLLDDGFPDTAFGSGGRAVTNFDAGGTNFDHGNAVAVQPDGKILVAGEAGFGPGVWRWAVVRFGASSGALDSSFGGGTGRVSGNFVCGVGLGCDYRDTAWGLALQGDRKIVLAGAGRGQQFDTDFGATRLLPNGAIDPWFGTDGVMFDGTTTFDFDRGPGGHDDYGYAMTLAPDGSIVVAGSTEWNGFDTDFGWVRLQNSYLFADGFEWGNTGRWSSSTP